MDNQQDSDDMNDLREYGIMLPRSTLQSVITALGLAVAGLGAWWLGDRLLMLVVGTLAWYLGGMAFCYTGIVALIYALNVMAIKNAAWHEKFDKIQPARSMPEIEYPAYYESIVRGVDIDPSPPIPSENFRIAVRAFEAHGIDQAHLHMIAHRVINKEARLTYAEFTPHWNGMTVGKFRKFVLIMDKKLFSHWLNPAEHRESILLNPSGEDFLADILKFIPPTQLDENWEKPA